MSSTQVLLTQILHLFARSHFEELLNARFVCAIGCLLSHQTRLKGDERSMDEDVQHAALMLVLQVYDLGTPAQVRLQELDLPVSAAAAAGSTHLRSLILILEFSIIILVPDFSL